MTSIIKSRGASNLSAIQSVSSPISMASVISIDRHDEERGAILQRAVNLEEELRRRAIEADDLRLAIAEAREDGRAQGYEAGLAAAQDRQSERLALLEKSFRRAEQDIAESVELLSRLSALLAQDCLDIMLGSATHRAEIIAEILEGQVARIERSALIEIRLSRLDFPHDREILALGEKLKSPSIKVVASQDLASGACIMTLRLGKISVGIDQQWPTLRRLLDEIALPGKNS